MNEGRGKKKKEKKKKKKKGKKGKKLTGRRKRRAEVEREAHL
jgi:hypothetical protein